MYKKQRMQVFLPPPPRHAHSVAVTTLNSVCILLGLSIGTHACPIYLTDYNCVFSKAIPSQCGKCTEAFFKQAYSQLFSPYIFTL